VPKGSNCRDRPQTGQSFHNVQYQKATRLRIAHRTGRRPPVPLRGPHKFVSDGQVEVSEWFDLWRNGA
jgi:hypothetical protein